MKILIVDNNVEKPYWGSSSLVRFAAQTVGSTIHVRRGPHDDLPKDVLSYDRVVLSGSATSCLAEAPWIDHLDQAIHKWIDAGIPLFGICYGHQSIVRALGGRTNLRQAESPEFGWTRLERTSASPLLEGLPNVFYSFSTHVEEVASLPKGLIPFARSEWCGIQGFQMERKPVFGVQFHPERDIAESELVFQELLGKNPSEVLLHAGDGRKYFDSKVGDKIFANFFKYGS